MVVKPSPSIVSHTKLALVGLPKFGDFTVTLGSLFPDVAEALANLTPVAAADVQAALDDPASDLAVATSRMAAAYAHIPSVRAACTSSRSRARCVDGPRRSTWA